MLYEVSVCVLIIHTRHVGGVKDKETAVVAPLMHAATVTGLIDTMNTVTVFTHEVYWLPVETVRVVAVVDICKSLRLRV